MRKTNLVLISLLEETFLVNAWKDSGYDLLRDDSVHAFEQVLRLLLLAKNRYQTSLCRT